mmetsp:Transcript_36895/g.102424  ORF Transcript_36895/g.102424 Transcript_36895/m.102424 type:complete len:203 (-) Transcript_36895:657-1265(-)
MVEPGSNNPVTASGAAGPWEGTAGRGSTTASRPAAKSVSLQEGASARARCTRREEPSEEAKLRRLLGSSVEDPMSEAKSELTMSCVVKRKRPAWAFGAGVAPPPSHSRPPKSGLAAGPALGEDSPGACGVSSWSFVVAPFSPAPPRAPAPLASRGLSERRGGAAFFGSAFCVGAGNGTRTPFSKMIGLHSSGMFSLIMGLFL